MIKGTCIAASLATAFLMIFASAADARFLQTDPVGYTADQNLYTYVANDPLNRTDPTGKVTTCTGSGQNVECTTTADTFNAAHSNGQTTLPTPAMKQAATAGAGAMASPGPNAQPGQESAGTLHQEANGDITVQPQTGQSGSTATGNTTTVTFHGPSDVAGIHGHIDSGPNASNGMVDDPKSNGNYGDTASLALPHPRPMATVSHGKVGWHGISNGRVQYQFLQGAMTPAQIQQMQQNLDIEQGNFQIP